MPRDLRVVLLPLALAISGCSDVLSVETPDIVRPEGLTTSAGLVAFRSGAYGDFVRSFSGPGGDTSPSGLVQLVCLFTDECHSTNTQGDDNQNDARRTTDTNGDVVSYYTDLHRARFALESAIERFKNTADAPERDEAIAEMHGLAGYTFLHFAESFCSGVPFSYPDGANIVFGKPETTQEMLARAIQQFDAGIAAATTARLPQLEYLGRVGKSRALLNLGEYAQAAQVVAAVPTTFLYTVKYSTNTPNQENGVRGAINIQKRNSVSTKHGDNGLDFFGAYDAGDPRTPYQSGGRGFDQTVHFLQLKYPLANSPVPLASGIEARLAEAEAFIATSNVAGFQGIHDALRATIRLPSVDTRNMTTAQRVDFHFRERALWTWLEGKRLGDLRRMVRNYGRAPNTVFPSGLYIRPHYPTFGDRVNLPVPRVERDNPNFTTACISDGA